MPNELNFIWISNARGFFSFFWLYLKVFHFVKNATPTLWYILIYKKFVWRQLGAPRFYALTSVGAFFILRKYYHEEEGY